MYEWLGGAISSGAEVVTASRRLARELHRHFDALQLADAREAWLTPAISSWDDWLWRLADSADPAQCETLRLGAHAESILWERCFTRHAGERPPGFGAGVRQSVRAWRMLKDWRIPVAALSESARTNDERLFATLAADYENRLVDSGWIDGAGMPALVRSLARAGAIRVPPRIVYAGYDRLVPQVEALFATLGELGSEVTAAPERHSGGRPAVRSFADPDAELRAAGAWAREVLQSEQDARVAIVCSALETDAMRATRLVREGFAPGWQQGGPAYRGAVNVSYGRRLPEFPAIHVALTVLRWASGPLGGRDVSTLMRTGLLGGPDAGGRSRLELRLRQMPDRAWSTEALLEALERTDAGEDAKSWLNAVRKIADFATGTTAGASPAAWAAAIDALLHGIGWPGAAALDSNAYQLVNRWRELLNEFAGLHPVAPALSLSGCVGRLATMAADTVFQPETDAGLIQLMGPLEAAGMGFDHLWISGLDVQHWPPPASPSPLISRALQRRFGMPDSSPEDTLGYARRVLARLVDSAPRVTMSWARADQDTGLTSSPLLEHFEQRRPDARPDPGWYAKSLQGLVQVRRIEDDAAPPVSADEQVAGGAYAVQRQAREPVSAFAYGRLGIRDLRPLEPGLSARLRGSLIHNALHRLYEEKPALEDIRGWLPAERSRMIERAIDGALGRYRRRADRRQQRLLSLEKVRLSRMLEQFVQAECERGGFRIEALEQGLSIRRHGVGLELRADRIDRLADGSLLIIDYKTGATRNLLTRDGELADLQLAVYASAVDEPVGGLALFNVDSRAVVYKGTGASVEWDAERRHDWDQRLSRWKAQVDVAIAELAAGDVRVDPRRLASRGRALNLLTRLEEIRLVR